MRRSFIPQVFIGLSAGVALMLTTPLVQGEEEPFELRADHLTRHSNGMLTLETDGQVTGLITNNNVRYVVAVDAEHPAG